MDSNKVPGWYTDAMEQNIGRLIVQQRRRDASIEELVALFMDPGKLDDKEHRVSLAVCFAICLRRLAQVDV